MKTNYTGNRCGNIDIFGRKDEINKVDDDKITQAILSSKCLRNNEINEFTNNLKQIISENKNDKEMMHLEIDSLISDELRKYGYNEAMDLYDELDIYNTL